MNKQSQASYLLRFDDICPTMRWKNWEPIESVLLEYNIRPIMAVIPDNRDSDLQIELPNPQFWSRVRKWQEAGWTVGIHGYQHTYVTGHPGLYSNRRASEFAGLPPAEQRQKLTRALSILRNEGISSNLWVAPGHSFDRTTLAVLRDLGVNWISDGFSISPYTDQHGTFWIPQQLSERQMFSAPDRPSEPRRSGVWTVCFHHNAWTEGDIRTFRREVSRYIGLFTSPAEVHAAYRGRRVDWLDRVQIARFGLRRRVRLFLADGTPARYSAEVPELESKVGPVV